MTQKQPSENFSNLSRRRFLQVSSLGVAATFIGNLGFDLTPEQAAAVAARRQAGTLRVAWGTPATLDPLNASADSEIAFLNAVYDYLIDTNAQSELIPRLASEWATSEDGLTYTLTLQEGATFHSGDALTGEDVVWTFNRLREGGSTADLYANVANVEATGDNTVVFTLSEPNPDFLFDLSDNRAVILQANAEEIGETFNGTGPFVLEDYLVGNRAVFTANTNYWGTPTGVETLEFLYFSDLQAGVSALQGGEVDIALRMDNATFLALSGEASLNAVDVPTNGHDLVRIRVDREPGNDPRVVEAFKLATDRQDIYERIQFGFGAVGRDTPIGPIYGDFYTEDTPIPARDPDAARALLEEAGYGDGLNMTLFVPNSGDRPRLAEALEAQWSEAGINITIELQDEATYYADDGWLEVDLGITGWGSRPRPQFYLQQAYKTGAVWNESHISDSELDSLIDAAAVTLDTDERASIYAEIQRILIERGPVIIPYFFAAFMVTADNVSDVDLHPFPGRTNFNTAAV